MGESSRKLQRKGQAEKRDKGPGGGGGGGRDPGPSGGADDNLPVTPLSSSQSSISVTSSTSVPSSTIANLPTPSGSADVLQISDPGNATTCQSLIFLWNYRGTNVNPVTLTIVESQDPYTTDLLSNTNYNHTALRTLETNVPATAQTYTWNPVNVTEGWYRVMAGMPSFTSETESAPFFVNNGSDLQCLNSHSYNSTGSHKPSWMHRPHPHLGPGELIGVIIGAGIGVAVLGAAFFFPRLWRRALPTTKLKRKYLFY